MKAEVISIGSELVTGQTLDTNSQWLSTQLAEMGIRVHFHTTVADDLADNVAVFRTAAQRADLVLITGGLGPTQDDLTREALAAMAGVELILHEPSLEHIESLFARRGREMPERNRVQALFPAGSEPISNPDGTAPGIWVELTGPEFSAGKGRCTLVAMPGVPSEMKRMFHNEVAPRLARALNGNHAGVLLHRRIHCFGMGESALEEHVMDLTRRGREPEVGITVHQATITLRVTARGLTAADCRTAIEPTVALIYERLGTYVFGEEEDELEHAVAKLLAEQRATLAIAEAVTGGLIAVRLNAVAELADLFRGGLVARSAPLCHELLGIAPHMIDARGPVAREAVEAMAVGCRTRLSADLGLAVGERFVDAADPTPHVHVALATDNEVRSHRHNVGGDPAILQSRIAKIALNTVRLHLLAAQHGGEV